MDRVFFSLGALLGAVGVALGAFGAHVLKRRLGADMLAIFETGARYHLIHALALLVTGLAVASEKPGALRGAMVRRGDARDDQIANLARIWRTGSGVPCRSHSGGRTAVCCG